MKGNNSYLVRTSLHLSRQKFSKIDTEGIVLSLNENKALFAIQKLLDKTNYEGNIDGVQTNADENSFRFCGMIPRLQFCPVEYLKAYGLQRKRTSRGYQEYSANERKQALDALRSLADKKFKIVYKRTHWDDDNKDALTDVIVTDTPLIKIAWGILGMTADEKKKYDNDEFTEEELLRRSTIGIEISPILVDQIDGYYILLPDTLFTDIKQQLNKGKYSQYIPLFIEWLILQAEIQRRAKTGWKIAINYKKLAYKLRMDKLIQRRKWNEIKEQLSECYYVAMQLGYITSWETTDGKFETKEVFHLNRDRFCSTLKRSKLYPKKEHSLP